MASNGSFTTKRPHVVCLPLPIQSHIGAMLKLAKLLHHSGIFITFVNTEFNHRRLLQARGSEIIENLPPGFRFIAIPDGLPPLGEANNNDSQDIITLFKCLRLSTVEAPFSALIEELNVIIEASVLDFPPVSCIVADGFMTFTAYPTSEKFGIPLVNLWTVSACSLLCMMHFPMLKEKGLMPPTDYLETRIDWIPGMKNMRVRDLPSFPGNTDQDDVLFNYLKDATAKFDRATASIIHTFEALEPDVLNALSSMTSIPTYTVGPFQLLIDRLLVNETETNLKRFGSNLWTEDKECLNWIDSQETRSVLYINFGSLAFLTPEQLVEFAMGIAESKHPFLWIVRPDLVNGDKAVLPREFDEETKARAYVTEWCPQEEVLNHPSVGGFLTHCGWNSIIESVSAGVPMLCWPYFGDQQMNCKFVCKDWEVGLEIDCDVKRDKVERLVKELMDGEKGNYVKMKVAELKRLAFEASSDYGSSSRNLGDIVHEIVSTNLRVRE